MKSILTKICLIVLIGFWVTKLKSQNAISITDRRDGQVYEIVNIGDQVWFAEDLKYLPSIVGPVLGSDTIAYYYILNYKDTNVKDAKVLISSEGLGVLYNWTAAISACPSGWHLPSDSEWTKLTDFLGGEDVAGGKLKKNDQLLWESPNKGATNESGFAAVPEGQRSYIGTFYGADKTACLWWSATERDSVRSFARAVLNSDCGIYRNFHLKSFGFAVRCVKD